MSVEGKNSEFYGWKLVAAVFTIYLINTAFPYYGGSVLNAMMAKDLGLSRSELGFGFSAFLLFVGLSSPLVGVLVNKLGVRLTFTLGGLILALGAIAMAAITSTELQYYLFFGAICGLGFSFAGIIPVQSVITYWFKHKKPLAMSVVLCASGVGSMLAIPALSAAVEFFGNDWRVGWYIVCACCVVSAALALLFVRNSPEEMGQLPDGDASMEAAALADSAAHNAKGAIHHTDHIWTVAQALRTPAFWLIVFGTSAFTMVFNLCIAHGVVHMQDRGIDNSLAATSVGLLVMASVIGRLGSGTIGSKIEPRFTWCLGLVFMGIGLQTLAMIDSNWQIYVYALGVGAGFGACYVSLATMLGNYFGMAAFAPLLGIVTTVTCIVGALSPAMGGMIYDRLGDYNLAFTLLLCVAGIGALAIPFARPPKVQITVGA